MEELCKEVIRCDCVDRTDFQSSISKLDSDVENVEYRSEGDIRIIIETPRRNISDKKRMSRRSSWKQIFKYMRNRKSSLV